MAMIRSTNPNDQPRASAAAFFRDIRAKGGLSVFTESDASNLLRTFLQNIGAECCSTDQLLALSELALHAKDEEAAVEALNQALALSKRVDLVRYRLGRICLAASRYDAAAHHFAEGILVNSDYPLNWIGQAQASYALGHIPKALLHAERFADFGVMPPAKKELRFLEECADLLFGSGERARSTVLYKLLHRFAHPNPKIAVRLAEALLASSQTGEALATLREAFTSDNLDPWGRRALAHCESLVGNHHAAVTIAKAALSERPDDPGFAHTYLDAVVRTRDSQALRDAMTDLGGLLSAEGLCELQARSYLAENSVADAFATLKDVEIQPRTRVFWVAVDVAYAALSAGDIALATALAIRLQSVAGEEIAPFLIQVDLFIREQMWEEATAVLENVPPSKAREPEILLKTFELACFTQDEERATQLMSELEVMGLKHRQAVLPILRFLAEQQDWPGLVERALTWLAADFRYDQIGYVLFRAARRTRRHRDILASIEAIEGWRDTADLQRLHTAIAWDSAASVADMKSLVAEAPASPVMRQRMLVQHRIAARASLPPGRRALFLCTDATYLCATIVAMHSALEHSAPGREDVFLVVEDPVAELAARAIKPFQAAGFSVRVVQASEVVGTAEKLYPAYGLFTSGHTLASAAYYRIYFAKYLQKTCGYSRALYIDSDVLIRMSLDGLYDLTLAGHPLGARLEQARPEVKRAVMLHRLDDGRYFNSGVLLFDLAHDRLAHGLDRTMAAIADEAVTLLFHDQCALNLGFKGCFEPLDTTWNLPVTEQSKIADLSGEAGILHYLDRPKPWSAAYDGPCAALWLQQWERTAKFIGEADALELFRLSGD